MYHIVRKGIIIIVTMETVASDDAKSDAFQMPRTLKSRTRVAPDDEMEGVIEIVERLSISISVS